MRLSNSATMRTTLQSFAPSGFQCCGNTLTSTRLFFSIVEKCLAFATDGKNRPPLLEGAFAQIAEHAGRIAELR
jgi:hypothetical protein